MVGYHQVCTANFYPNSSMNRYKTVPSRKDSLRPMVLITLRHSLLWLVSTPFAFYSLTVNLESPMFQLDDEMLSFFVIYTWKFVWSNFQGNVA